MDILTLTDAATMQLQAMIAGQTPKPEAVFVSVKNTGCSGMSYDLQFLNSLSDAPKFADTIKAGDVTVVIDPKATMYLIGSQMDYQTSALKSGFEFINPNEAGRCGCGESFTVAKTSDNAQTQN
jgi:iron-sulfur cluster assembly protein